MEKCGALFEEALVKENPGLASSSEGESIRYVPGMTKYISLNKKALRNVLLAHADTDLSEMFRLWLDFLGFRFPIGFFYDQDEPAHVKIPHRAAYRRRSIAKIGQTIQICEFCTPEEAQKFVSCEGTEKGN